MAVRFKALVAVAAMFVASGCTIIHENPNAETPESAATDQQAQPADTSATPAPAATDATGGTSSNPNLRTRLRVPAKTPATRMVDSQNAQPQPQATTGTLDVQVIDGSCQLSVDGQDFGMTNKAQTQVSAGEHTVDCKPQEGQAQSHKANVKANDTTYVIISLQAGQAADGQVLEDVQKKLKQ